MYFVDEKAGNSGEKELILRFVKLTPYANEPKKSRSDSTGFTLYSAYDYEINSFEKALVLTDLQIAAPYGYCARLASRWDLAFYNSVQVLGLWGIF